MTEETALSGKLSSSVEASPFLQCFFETDVMQARTADISVNTNTQLAPERLLVGCTVNTQQVFSCVK